MPLTSIFFIFFLSSVTLVELQWDFFIRFKMQYIYIYYFKVSQKSSVSRCAMKPRSTGRSRSAAQCLHCSQIAVLPGLFCAFEKKKQKTHVDFKAVFFFPPLYFFLSKMWTDWPSACRPSICHPDRLSVASPDRHFFPSLTSTKKVHPHTCFFFLFFIFLIPSAQQNSVN